MLYNLRYTSYSVFYVFFHMLFFTGCYTVLILDFTYFEDKGIICIFWNVEYVYTWNYPQNTMFTIPVHVFWGDLLNGREIIYFKGKSIHLCENKTQNGGLYKPADDLEQWILILDRYSTYFLQSYQFTFSITWQLNPMQNISYVYPQS